MKRPTEPFTNTPGILFDNSEVTKMLEKRRMLYEVEEAFAIQNDEYRKNMEKLKLQEENIKRTDNKIQEKFVRHCKFLAENKDKRTRAKRHLEEERKVKEAKLEDIEIEEEALVQLDIQKSMLESKIAQMSGYEDFLKKVVDGNHEQYSNIEDLLQRFQILQQSNRKFAEQKLEAENYLNELNVKKSAFEKNKNLEMMVLNNEIASYQKQFDVIEAKNLKTLDEIKSEETHIHSKMATLAKLMLAVDNLEDLCLKSDIKIFKEKKTGLATHKKTSQLALNQNPEHPNQSLYKYNIQEVLDKIESIQNTAECIKSILEISNSKREPLKLK